MERPSRLLTRIVGLFYISGEGGIHLDRSKVPTIIGAGLIVAGTIVLTITGVGEAPIVAIVSAVVVLVGVIAALFKVSVTVK